jgi:hypothetical protein
MKYLVLILLFTLTILNLKAQVYVEGYYRKNGTYVEPHYRSSPDKNPYNNYSYPGNTNPYTGKVATGNPETYLKRYSSRSKSTNTYDYLPNGRNVEGYYHSYERDEKRGRGLGFVILTLGVAAVVGVLVSANNN